eukprot:scaffold48_cov395-Prasinococcus_capsulatus_cf.AAC.14
MEQGIVDGGIAHGPTRRRRTAFLAPPSPGRLLRVTRVFALVGPRHRAGVPSSVRPPARKRPLPPPGGIDISRPLCARASSRARVRDPLLVRTPASPIQVAC